MREMDVVERYQQERARKRLIAAIVAVVAATGLALWLLSPDGPKTPEPAPSPAAAAAPSPSPTPSVPTLPPSEGDVPLRTKARGLTSSPEVNGWLAQEGIIQRLAAAANLVAQGKSPRGPLEFVKLEGDFAVEEEIDKKPGAPGAPVDYSERIFTSEKAHRRYDRLTEMITSMDARSTAGAYKELRPYFDGAFQQIARPGQRFDDLLREALGRLVVLPVPEGRLELVPHGALYKYKDPSLESKTPVEKHLLRFGPENQKRLQAWLRDFATHAGL